MARLGGRTVACGGFRPLGGGAVEIKRMYVVPAARRHGVARALLDELHRRAAAAGHTEVWLETGTEQPEAIALYRSAGYRPRPPFGEFAGDERSRCFARPLPGPAGPP